jgi:hypothetical protein
MPQIGDKLRKIKEEQRKILQGIEEPVAPAVLEPKMTNEGVVGHIGFQKIKPRLTEAQLSEMSTDELLKYYSEKR